MPQPPSAGFRTAPHVQAALARGGQAKLAAPMAPMAPPNRLAAPHAPRGQVLQGFFPGGPPRGLPTAAMGGTIQPRTAGTATPLPPALPTFRPNAAGERLPPAVQARMEQLFGADFSEVRVHVGPEAPTIGALAFTLGSHLYFAPGQYAPATSHGQRLLGHELAHVVQQRAGRVRNPFGSGVAVVQDPGLEAEAERWSLRTALPPPRAASPFARAVQRSTAPSSSAAASGRAPMDFAALQDQWEQAVGAGDEKLITALEEQMDAIKRPSSSNMRFVGKQSEPDFSWIPKGVEQRPAQYANTFSLVYGVPPVPAGGADLQVLCKEGCGKNIVLDGATYREKDGVIVKDKKPPICHKIAYNHLAVAWSMLMLEAGYKGPKPGAFGFEVAHKDLTWGNLGNLQPGHAACNGGGAVLAIGPPDDDAIRYVVGWAKAKKFY